MRNEGVEFLGRRVGKRVPICRRDLGDALDEACARSPPISSPVHAGRLHVISNIASTSTATLRGSEPAPTAARACLPVSPNTCTIKSEAPLTTSGCCVKPGIALTKPVSLTQRLTRSRSPPQASRSCAIRLRPHKRRRGLTLLDREILADVSNKLEPGRADGHLAGNEYELSADHVGHVVRNRRHRLSAMQSQGL